MELTTKKEFVKKLKEAIGTYRVNQKEYRLVSATRNRVIMKDPKEEQTYEVPTDALYQAYTELKDKVYKVGDVKQYVGKEAGSTSAALLKHINSTHFLWEKMVLSLLDNMRSELIEGDFGNYEDCLHLSTIEQLKNYAHLYGIPKGEWSNEIDTMADTIYRFATDKVSEWLYDIPVDDLIFTKSLVDEDDSSSFLAEFPHPMITILLGITEEDVSEDGNDKYSSLFSCKDMMDIIMQHIDGVIERKMAEHEDVMERIFWGMLNIRGCMSKDKIRNELTRLVPKHCPDITESKIDAFLQHSIICRMLLEEWNDADGDTMVYSMMYPPTGYSRKRPNTPYPLDKLEDIMAHGTYPLLTPYRPCEKDFNAFVSRYLTESEFTYHYVMVQDENFGVKGCLTMLMESLLDAGANVEGINEEFKNMIMDFYNNIPRFEFKGYSPTEIRYSAERQLFSQQPGLTPLPYLAENRVKIGRNDPCPCGSGKKFKHCCGKSN